jgi:hypothetical protein
MFGPRFEKFYPVGLALAASAMTLPIDPWIASNRAYVAVFVVKLFGPALNVSAIAVGFLATSQSILITLKDSPGIEQMKTDGYHAPFVNFLSSATTSSFCLAVLSGVFSAMDFSRLDWLHGYLIALWVLVCVMTLLAYYRAVSLLPYVLRGTVPRCASKTTFTPFDANRR